MDRRRRSGYRQAVRWALLGAALAVGRAAGADTVAQQAEDGTWTVPLSVSLAGPLPDARSSEPFAQELCETGARWLRVGVAELTLRGGDTVSLVPASGPALVFSGDAWQGRRFFTRALEGECLQLQARLAHPQSRVVLEALQAGRTDLALSGVVVAAVGDLCDSIHDCSRTAALVSALAPARVVLAGDNAYSTGSLREYLRNYAPYYGPFKAKTLPVPGNHEYATDAAAGYFDYFNGVGVFDGPAGRRDRGYYSVDLGDWHVVALNSNLPRGPGSKQELWLRDDLAASTKPCTMAVFHHPRFNIGMHGPDLSVQALYQALQDFKADLIVNGHDHNYQRWPRMTAAGVHDDVHGVREIVVGTGGRVLYPIGSAPEVESANGDTWGVLKLTLTAAAYRWEFLPVAGSTFTDGGLAACKEKVAAVGSER
jgi:calcineurin-like phosphoesterase family protein